MHITYKDIKDLKKNISRKIADIDDYLQQISILFRDELKLILLYNRVFKTRLQITKQLLFKKAIYTKETTLKENKTILDKIRNQFEQKISKITKQYRCKRGIIV